MKEMIVEWGGTLVSKEQDVVLTIKGLGSTLAVVVTDPTAKVTGIGHCILPKPIRKNSKVPDVLTQIRQLFKDMIKFGAKATDFKVMLFGAATFLEAPSEVSLGVMLYKRAKAALEKNAIKIAGEHVGGPVNRSVSIKVGSENASVFLPDNKEIVV